MDKITLIIIFAIIILILLLTMYYNRKEKYQTIIPNGEKKKKVIKFMQNGNYYLTVKNNVVYMATRDEFIEENPFNSIKDDLEIINPGNDRKLYQIKYNKKYVVMKSVDKLTKKLVNKKIVKEIKQTMVPYAETENIDLNNIDNFMINYNDNKLYYSKLISGPNNKKISVDYYFKVDDDRYVSITTNKNEASKFFDAEEVFFD